MKVFICFQGDQKETSKRKSVQVFCLFSTQINLHIFKKQLVNQLLILIKPRTEFCINPFSANHTKWSNTLKQFVGKLPTNCLSVFEHFVRLAPKRLNKSLWPGSKISRIPYVNNLPTSILNNKWKNVFKNEKNKICGRQPLKT